MAHTKLKNVIDCQTGEVSQIEMTEKELNEINEFIERSKLEILQNGETF